MKKFKKSLPILMAISSLFGSVANASESGGAKQKRTALDNTVTAMSCLAIAPRMLVDASSSFSSMKRNDVLNQAKTVSILHVVNDVVNTGSFISEEASKGKSKNISKFVNYCSSYAATFVSAINSLNLSGSSKLNKNLAYIALWNKQDASAAIQKMKEHKYGAIAQGVLSGLGGVNLVAKTIRDLKQSK